MGIYIIFHDLTKVCQVYWSYTNCLFSIQWQYPVADNCFEFQESLVEALYGLNVWDRLRALVNVIKILSDKSPATVAAGGGGGGGGRRRNQWLRGYCLVLLIKVSLDAFCGFKCHWRLSLESWILTYLMDATYLCPLFYAVWGKWLWLNPYHRQCLGPVSLERRIFFPKARNSTCGRGLIQSIGKIMNIVFPRKAFCDIYLSNSSLSLSLSLPKQGDCSILFFTLFYSNMIPLIGLLMPQARLGWADAYLDWAKHFRNIGMHLA